MARSLGSSEAHVDILGGDDGLEVDVEAVGEEEQTAGLQVGGDIFCIQFGLGLVWGEDHDHVGPLGSLGGGGDFKAGLLGLGAGLGGGGEADLYMDAGVLEAESVCVALRAVADDGDLLCLDEGEVGVVIVISLCHVGLDFPFRTGDELMLRLGVGLPGPQKRGTWGTR